MKAHDLLVSLGKDRSAEDEVLAFFERLADLDLDGAEASVTGDFTWFGRSIHRTAWRDGALISFLEGGISAKDARVIPEALVAEMKRDADVLGGPVPEGASVVLVDVLRSGVEATAALVVGRDGKIIRIFDPEAAREYLLSLSEGLYGS